MDWSKLNPADYGFDLNNREIASLIWLALIAAWVLSMKQTRASAFAVFRAFFAWKLQCVFLAMTLYSVGAVALLAMLNLWEWTNLKTTLLWWVTVGFVSVLDSQRLSEKPNAFRDLLKDAVSVTAVITFIAEAGSFPLLVELLLPVPLTLLGGMLAMAPLQKGGEVLVKPLTWITMMAGLGFVAWGVREVLADTGKFLAWNTLREFGDPILLSIAFIPFLFGLSAYIAHESAFTTLRIMWKRPDLARYVQRRAFWSFAHDLDGMRRLARDLKIGDIEDRKGVDETIRLTKRLKRREKHPPILPAVQGWSPYEAIRFLATEGVVAGDWHPSFGEWRAEASVVKLGDGFSPDNVSFFLSGSEFAATRLVLILHTDHRNNPAESDRKFNAMVLSLLEQARSPNEASALFARLRDQKDVVIRESNWRFSMKRDDWGDEKFGGYSRNFKISHSAHVAKEFDEEFNEVAEDA